MTKVWKDTGTEENRGGPKSPSVNSGTDLFP